MLKNNNDDGRKKQIIINHEKSTFLQEISIHK